MQRLFMQEKTIPNVSNKLFFETVIRAMLKNSDYVALMTLAKTCTAFYNIIMPELEKEAARCAERAVQTMLQADDDYCPIDTHEFRQMLLDSIDRHPQLLFVATRQQRSLLQHIIDMADIYLFEHAYQSILKHNLVPVLKKQKLEYTDQQLKPLLDAALIFVNTDCDDAYSTNSQKATTAYHSAQKLIPFWLLTLLCDSSQSWDPEADIQPALANREILPILAHVNGLMPTQRDIYFAMLTTNHYVLTKEKDALVESYHLTVCPKEKMDYTLSVYCAFFDKAQSRIKALIDQPAAGLQTTDAVTDTPSKTMM